MKILITGGCGFIGVNVIRHLAAKATLLRVLDNLSTGDRRDLPDGVEVVVGDIRNPVDLDLALRDIDAVIHLAAHTRVVESIEAPHDNFQVNVDGTFGLLEAMRKARVGKLIFASTGGAIIGDQEPPVHEQMVARPISPYGASKLCGEAYCSAFSGAYGMTTICLRFSNVYGPYSYRKGSVVAHFFKQVLTEQPLIIFGDGLQTRDFLFVGDLCKGLLAALEVDLRGHHVFQIASGRETIINDLCRTMLGVIGRSEYPIVHKPERKGEVRRNYANITHAKAVLDYSPSTILDGGLAKTWRWFLQWKERGML